MILGIALNATYPSFFEVGDPPTLLRAISIILLIPGITIWIWSVILILAKVPRGELITTGPYSMVKHPLYTSVSLLVLPWLGFLLDTWLGVPLGIVFYTGSRLSAPEEEAALSASFGIAWDEYRDGVKIPWL